MTIGKFRNFNHVHMVFSSYDNGNVKAEAYDGSLKLGELTSEIDRQLPRNIVAFKTATYIEEFLSLFMGMDIIKYYTKKSIDGIQFYLCNLVVEKVDSTIDGPFQFKTIGGAL